MARRIGLITDIHSGPDIDTRLGTAAFPLLDKFVETMSQRFRPDLIVDLGDRINDVNVNEDTQRIQKVRSCLESIGVPIFFLYGNHDLVNTDQGKMRKLLGKQSDFESVDFMGYHFIFLNTQDPTFGGVGGTISEDQLHWLEDDLDKCVGPAVIFSHHPLDEQKISSHWFFGKHPEFALAVNREQARTLFTRSQKVRAVFNGHMHWNNVEVIDGIPYVTVESLVDGGLTDGNPAGGFTELVFEENGRIELEVRGKLPMSFTYPLKKIPGK
jgi:3',5'-cyclic AMP phosphodiesterase CpdA